MPRRITETQRQAVLRMLARDVDRETIAASVGVTPGQVSAVAAHVKMGTYELPAEVEESRENVPEERARTRNLLRQLYDLEGSPAAQTRLSPILLGTDATWNPVRGCTKISPGCTHCYAETFAERFRGVPGHPYEQGFDLRLVPEKLAEPLR
jgi:hypothetical protein